MISWFSRKHSIISLSKVEEEYIVDFSTIFESIWLQNLVEQYAMYSASTVLSETLDCFLLNHELIADPKQKHLPNDTSIPICICSHGFHHSKDQSI